MLDGGPGEGLTDAPTTHLLVDHHVLDPGPQAGRDAEHHEGERAHDLIVELGHEQCRPGVGNDLRQLVRAGRRRGARELRDQTGECGSEVECDLPNSLDFHHVDHRASVATGYEFPTTPASVAAPAS